MPIHIFRSVAMATAIGLVSISMPKLANASSEGIVESSSAGIFESQTSTLESHFSPQPSVMTRLDFDAWDFILSETVLFMGPSTRLSAPRKRVPVGTLLKTGNKSRLRMEGNKPLYTLMKSNVKSEIKSYADDLVAIGNNINVPSLPKNEQLAYWINLHNAVLLTTVIENYPGPKRQPNLIKPIKNSDAKLHDAKLFEIDGYALSLRDIREKIVFPNWKNKDVPYAFHLGYLSSPSLANVAYNGSNLRTELKRNAEEFVNSLRGYEKGVLNPYFKEVSTWYHPAMGSELDNYFQKRMRSEVYAEYQTHGIKNIDKQDLTIADITGGYGHGRSVLFANESTTSLSRDKLGTEIDDYLRDRRIKSLRLKNKEWFKSGTVTIIDIETEDKGEIE